MQKSFNNNRGPAKQPNIIYAEDELFAGKTENGWYLFHSTLDPSEKYKQKRIATLSERPSKEYILEKIVYGQMGDKLKYRLDKEKLSDWITEEYKFIVSDKPSPWAPKKLGVSTGPVKRKKPVSSDDEDDSGTEPDEPETKKQAAAPAITSTEVTDEILKKIEDCFILLQQIAAEKRLNPVDGTQ